MVICHLYYLRCSCTSDSSITTEQFLSGFNCYSNAVAANARGPTVTTSVTLYCLTGRLCKLGEDVVPLLLQLWSKYSLQVKVCPTPQLSDTVVPCDVAPGGRVVKVAASGAPPTGRPLRP